MPIFNRNDRPAYYSLPTAFRASIGAAAITAFPSASTPAAIAAITGAQASANLVFSGQPTANSQIGINGINVTFVNPGNGGFTIKGQALQGTILSNTGVPLGYQATGQSGLTCEISSLGLLATMMNFMALLRSWPDESSNAFHLRLRGSTIQISASQTGTAGNAIQVGATAGAGVSIVGAATIAPNVAGQTTLTGGTAPTNGYAVLVEPQSHPVELTNIQAICRGYLTTSPGTNAGQTAGTMTLLKSDGATLTKVPQGTIAFPAGNTLAAAVEMAPIAFPLITATAPLVLPAWMGLYAYGSTTQAIDLEAAPAGVY